MSKIDRDCTRLLQTSASNYSLLLSTTWTESRPWASALFVGHRMKIAVEGDDDARLDEWLIALPDVELVWRGHFVASAEVVERSANAATIELLVVED
ncbi:MAG: hypothetical protein ABIR08_01270 [Sphingomonas sp.]